MKKRLVADDHVKAISTEQENVLELFNLLDQSTWNLEESIVPWVAAENKIGKLNEFLHHEVSTNNFRDFVENVLNSSLHVVCREPKTLSTQLQSARQKQNEGFHQ